MLIDDFHTIGNKLLAFRKRAGKTQAEVAESASLSDRTYADIERGTVNMRISTLIKICEALGITPNDLLSEEQTDIEATRIELSGKFELCSPKEQDTILKLVSAYLDSVRK